MKTKKSKYGIYGTAKFMLKTAIEIKSPSVIIICVITAALAVITSLLGLFVVPTILEAIEEAMPLPQLIALILAFAGGMMIVGAITAYVEQNTIFGRIGLRLQGGLAKINKKTSQTSYINMTNTGFMESMRRAYELMQSNGVAMEQFWTTFTNLLKNLAGLVIYLILISSLSGWILGLVIATTVASFFVTRHTSSWRSRNKDEEKKYSSRLWYLLDKSHDKSIAKDIRLFGMKPWIEDLYQSTNRLFRNFQARNQRYQLIGNVADVVLSFLRNGIAYIYLIGLVINTDMTAPEFLLLFTAIGGLTTWMSGVLADINTLHVHSIDISTVMEFLEYPEPFKFEEGLPLPVVDGKGYEIKLSNVSFRYPSADKDTLTNINLTIAPGENLAIVGLNGAGKTTLIKLICGLLDPTSGEVLLDGKNIKDYNRADIYQHFTALFQDFSILPITVAENIAQARPENLDMDRVKTSAQLAGISQKIEDLTDGYLSPVTKTVYNHGVEFSGGETQRLLLARALYKKAPIIALDEPTSALDPIAEREIYEKYHSLTSGRTSIYISHRLSSTRFCDRVILIDKNQITEEGTHDQLLAQGGEYAKLYDLQSHYYQ